MSRTQFSVFPSYSDCKFILEKLSDILAFILGALSDCIYVNASRKDQIHCGSISRPCSSLSFTINNVSCHNDTICLIASPIKQIRYTVANTIVIKHSLTVTKFPAYGQNPLITYDPMWQATGKSFTFLQYFEMFWRLLTFYLWTLSQ